MSRLSASCRALIAVIALLGVILPGTAHAYWRGGVFYGVAPIVPYYPPPIYAPPPVVYAPPPVVYAPPPSFSVTPPGFAAPGSQSAGGPSCYAGPYVCPLTNAMPLGAPCSCPGNNGRVAGSVH
jgi:hypothetical protein